MPRPAPFLATITCLLAPLLLASCRKEEIVVYRVAKSETSAPTAVPVANPAAVVPQANMADTTVATATGLDLTWTPPSGWQSKAGSAMRKGTYLITDAAGASAELAITAFPGDVGGEVANVNRWRGQLQLGPLTETEVSAGISRSTVNGLSVAVVDFANSTSSPPQRMLGAMIPFGGATWFFKLMGPDTTVAAAKPAFLAFLQTVKPSQPVPAPTP
jgi:hypothetical protein